MSTVIEGGFCGVREAAIPASPMRRRYGALALLVSMIVSFLAASASLTPLYQRYDAEWHGTALTTTETFGIYALAVLFGLLLFGELSNYVGRRPVLFVALALQSIALALFATAHSYEPLFVGRVLQGVAAGAALGTISAMMIELHRVFGTTASSAAPGAGTGFGALVAGVLVAYLPWPTHLIYVSLIVVFAIQAIGVAVLLDANPTRAGVWTSLRPKVAIPSTARSAFVVAVPVLFASWALAGFYGSLGPALVHVLAPGANVAAGGIALFVMAGTAAVLTYLRRSHDSHVQLVHGAAALVVGVILTVIAIEASSIWGFLAATLVSGAGFGMGLQGAIGSVTALAQQQERPGLLSAVYVVSYAAMGGPAVIAGWLVSRGYALTDVAIGYAGVLVVLAAAAGLKLVKR